MTAHEWQAARVAELRAQADSLIASAAALVQQAANLTRERSMLEARAQELEARLATRRAENAELQAQLEHELARKAKLTDERDGLAVQTLIAESKILACSET